MMLAVIGVVDAAVLSALAFVLATRHVNAYPPEPVYGGSVYKGDFEFQKCLNDNSCIKFHLQ